MSSNGIYRLPGQQQPSRQILFQNALLDVYQECNGLYGFTYYRHQGYWDTYHGSPIFLSPQAALRQAKLLTLKENVSKDTESCKLLVDFSTDTILRHSRLVKKLFGKITDYKCRDLYIAQSDRAEIHRRLLQSSAVQRSTRLQSLDGKEIDCVVEAELIQLDTGLRLIVETIKPGAVLHSP